MRVIGGKYRNRNLKAGAGFRPTTDRVRETLFNILQNDTPNSVFVDGFAGSGAVGIEAISRGAAMVYFLETSRRSLRTLEDNLTACCDGENWRIYTLDVLKGLEVIHAADPAAGILFFDPPYDFQSYTGLLGTCLGLFPAALTIIESSARSQYSAPPGAQLFKQRRIGETVLSFFRAG
jgi:16S rRNA (guanine966-N2)-methyltransferase